MWKDFFYFTKSQRIGIIVLLILILFVIALNYSLPLFFKENNVETSFLNEAKSFKKTLVLRDSIQRLEWLRKYREKYQKYSIYSPTERKKNYQLFNFDPNSLDSASFIQLGIKSFIASNIEKYRKKGGIFRSKAEFAKVYGITKEKYAELEPYIIIDEKVNLERDSLKLKNKTQNLSVMVDLNTSDTAQLMQVKGIGLYYANAIVRYRNALGGFVSVDQLNEIKGMRPETYEKIKSFCTADPNQVKKIKVNIASAEKLNSHPYLNFYQAKAIYELRRKRGKILIINELLIIPEFTQESLNRIQPYLSFE